MIRTGRGRITKMSINKSDNHPVCALTRYDAPSAFSTAVPLSPGPA